MCGITQEKQSSHCGIKHTCSRLQGRSFPYTVFNIIFHTMYGLLVEATLVILEEPTVHGREISFHNLYSLDVWNNVLGPWLQSVSHDEELKNNLTVQALMVFLQSTYSSKLSYEL